MDEMAVEKSPQELGLRVEASRLFFIPLQHVRSFLVHFVWLALFKEGYAAGSLWGYARLGSSERKTSCRGWGGAVDVGTVPRSSNQRGSGLVCMYCSLEVAITRH